MFFLLVIITAAAFGCRKGNSGPGELKVDSIGMQYLIAPSNPYPVSGIPEVRAKLYFVDGAIVKRSGVRQSVWTFDVNDAVFDTLMYSKSELIIEHHPGPLNATISNRWHITLKNGKPVQRISYQNNQGQYMVTDTADYYYNAKQQIEKIESNYTVFNSRNKVIKQFYFDANNNLSRVSTVYYVDNKLWSTTVEEFVKYDNAKNPLKQLWMWDDIYYRSLSANNFAEYSYVRWDDKNNPVEVRKQTLPLQYDASGNIIYR